MAEEKRPEDQSISPTPATVKECVHKTKLVEFLGRTTPIVLQNDNGPCPLLAICNILLLKNNFNLTPDTTEVSQEKLLSLVAERLIDSNSNINDKDEGYAENQQQNIADAIDLLPRLATGIDVNIKFRRIDDFEFTRECAIFDLLDIPLYHGWIVDPQDVETANAIGSKSYNALMEELVALETRIFANPCKNVNASEEDCVDFAAATAATLGVPSPCHSKDKSFDDSPCFSSDHQSAFKGDLEEESDLLRALEISQTELTPSIHNPLVAEANDEPVSSSPYENVTESKPVGDSVENNAIEKRHILNPDPSLSDYSNKEKCTSNDSLHFTGVEEPEVNLLSNISDGNILDSSTYIESEGRGPAFDVGEKSSVDSLGQIESSTSFSSGGRETLADDKLDNETADKINAHDLTELSCKSAPNGDLNSDTSSGRTTSENMASSESEPLYEGEDCIMDLGTLENDQEPVYEGEGVLAYQADKSTLESMSKEGLSIHEGELIQNFLKSNASQLTINGLFCLQAGLKERELCVFFRNNHFSTMFKFNGELYLLATDQGYITQSDLVWEKLNEVNGDSQFMTGSFKEFKLENRTNESWNETNAVTSVVDYIARIDNEAQAGMDINSDLQYAIALQQEEMDHQQRQQRQNSQPQQPQQSVTGNSRLITGPNVPRSSARNNPSSYPRTESKSKEKCTLM